MDQEPKSIFYEAETPQASRELDELRRLGNCQPPFVVVRRRVIDGGSEGKMTIDATVVIRIGDVEETEAARGVGVVHALDLALRKALLKYFPFLESVRVIETYMHASGESTDAEVMWIGISPTARASGPRSPDPANTAEAGWQSLVDGYEWRMDHHERNRARRNRIRSRL